ncbi:MAG: GGDEF domain-containing protein [Rhodocyclaceae bacterium]|nr:GGDEF domain-containing protein [Rhodocyclaceae bacterium]
MSDSCHRSAVSAASPTDGSFEFRCLETVLNSLDALVYVSDMQTYELIFVSQYGLKTWGRPEGKKCYQYLQADQSTPCAFCTNDRLVDADSKPTGVLVWEFQNTITQRWYQCRDQAIPWVDGRLVRMEIAVDITDRKRMEDALQQARQQAEALARVDALTQVYNRLAFYEHMEHIYGHLQRKPAPMSLVMLDIDHFKRLNDTYGHAFGDEVLVALCKNVRADLREDDQLFRIGGEEFVVVFSDCERSAVQHLVERLRRNIEAMALYANGEPVKFTCSFGIAEHRPGIGIDALLANADAALYAAKQSGRNRVCVADGHTH